MGHDQHEQSNSSGAVVAAVAVVMLVAILGIVAIAGAGLLFFGQTRMNVSRAVATAEINRAIVETKRAEVKAVEAMVQQQQRQAGTTTEIPNSNLAAEPAQEPTLVVTLDREGNTAIDGESLGLAELRARLTRLKDQTSSALTVQINVDRACLFEKLAPVFAACHELGGVEVRLALSSESDSEPAESDADN